MSQQTTYEFESIGTRWWCEILSDDVFSPELREEMAMICETFDQRYSRFRDDSLVTELCLTGKLDSPPAEFVDMLDFAKQMHEASLGAFSLAVGPRLHALGYGTRAHGGSIDREFWQHVCYNKQQISAPKGLMLDFGGQGKGWLIDLLVQCMRRHHTEEFIINGGGDLYVQSQNPIEIALEHPTNPSQMIGTVHLQNSALAASSTLKRRWEHDGRTHHHIIDPETSESSDTGVIATYVIATTALIADVMATILIVRPDLEERLAHEFGLQTVVLKK